MDLGHLGHTRAACFVIAQPEEILQLLPQASRLYIDVSQKFSESRVSEKPA